MKIFIGILLIIHGLITAAQSGGSFKPTGGVPNLKWLDWWPTPLGQSWLLARWGLEHSLWGTLAGILWLVAAACLIAAGLGLIGLVIPASYWRILAGCGAVLSLVLLIIYAHPLNAVGIGANLAILLVMLWARWPKL